MASHKSSLGDGEIMQNTKVQADHRFAFQFPNGEVLRSDPIPPDKRKAGVIVAWCEAVRAKDADIKRTRDEERAALKAARKRAEEDSHSEPQSSEQPSRTVEPSTSSEPTAADSAAPSAEATGTPATSAPGPQDDPEEWIRHNYEAAVEALKEAERQHSAALAVCEKWERLWHALDS